MFTRGTNPGQDAKELVEILGLFLAMSIHSNTKNQQKITTTERNDYFHDFVTKNGKK